MKLLLLFTTILAISVVTSVRAQDKETTVSLSIKKNNDRLPVVQKPVTSTPTLTVDSTSQQNEDDSQDNEMKVEMETEDVLLPIKALKSKPMLKQKPSLAASTTESMESNSKNIHENHAKFIIIAAEVTSPSPKSLNRGPLTKRKPYPAGTTADSASQPIDSNLHEDDIKTETEIEEASSPPPSTPKSLKTTTLLKRKSQRIVSSTESIIQADISKIRDNNSKAEPETKPALPLSKSFKTGPLLKRKPLRLASTTESVKPNKSNVQNDDNKAEIETKKALPASKNLKTAQFLKRKPYRLSTTTESVIDPVNISTNNNDSKTETVTEEASSRPKSFRSGRLLRKPNRVASTTHKSVQISSETSSISPSTEKPERLSRFRPRSSRRNSPELIDMKNQK